jgi:hypothetical protein
MPNLKSAEMNQTVTRGEVACSQTSRKQIQPIFFHAFLLDLSEYRLHTCLVIAAGAWIDSDAKESLTEEGAGDDILFSDQMI